MKRALCEAPVLQIPDFNKEFVLATDTSDVAVSPVLDQRVNGGLAPISYYSRLLTAPEKRYSTHEKECLAVLFGCERCRTYLEHKQFELCCDNLALCWLLKSGIPLSNTFLYLNALTPNDLYMSRTAPLTAKRCILYIYSANVGTEYFKRALYSPFFSLQNAVCFIMLTCLVPVLFTFYIQCVLKLKKK